MGTYCYAEKLFGQAEVPPDLEEQLKRLHQAVDQYFPEGLAPEQRKICIFCAGYHGEALYWELRERLILADFFSDNSPEKWGYSIDGVSCIPPSELEKYKDCALIIVANQNPSGIVKDLRDKGYRYVITKQVLEPVLRETPPVKWISMWQSCNDLDYSTPEAQQLVQQFSSTVFDICAYFYSKIG